MSDSDRPVDPKLVAMLLEDECWTPYHGTDAPGTPPDENRKYLEEHVFPTLIPALADLLTLVQLDSDGNLPKNYSGLAAGPKNYGPTGSVPPTDWIAQYLMRNNQKHHRHLDSHPYVILRNALKQKRTKENEQESAEKRR